MQFYPSVLDKGGVSDKTWTIFKKMYPNACFPKHDYHDYF